MTLFDILQRNIAFKQITPGTRPTVAGVPVTVFGGTGFVGRYVINAIGAPHLKSLTS